MTTQVQLTGTLNLQLTDEARPAPIPLSFGFNFSEYSLHQFNHTSVVTNQAVNQGTVANPRGVLIQVLEGSVDFSWDIAGAGAWRVSANPTPPPTDVPFMLYFTHNAPVKQLYLTVVTAPARGRVWVFE